MKNKTNIRMKNYLCWRVQGKGKTTLMDNMTKMIKNFLQLIFAILLVDKYFIKTLSDSLKIVL